MLKGKSGETVALALKQLLSVVLMTSAATLVPPDPNPVASLTYRWKTKHEFLHKVARVQGDETYHCDELR